VAHDAGSYCSFDEGGAILDPELLSDETEEQGGTSMMMETVKMTGDYLAQMMIFGEQELVLLILTEIGISEASSYPQKPVLITKRS